MRRRKPSSESDGSRPASSVNCASAVRSAASSTSALSSWKRSPAGSASSSRKPPCRRRHDSVGLGQLQQQAPLPAAACALRLADGWPGTGHGAVGPILPNSNSPAATSMRHTCSCSACQSKPAAPHSASVAQALKRQGAGTYGEHRLDRPIVGRCIPCPGPGRYQHCLGAMRGHAGRASM